MCDPSIIRWFEDLVRVHQVDFNNKSILEVGSKFVNGSVRPIIATLANPLSYLGVDVSEGKYVDMVVPAEKLVEKFGENVFDIVISTEMLEHVYDWKIVIDNLKRIVRPGGTLIVTTRSIGAAYHAFPYDFWRYEPEDMRTLFSDFMIELLHYDSENVGVWLKAKKPLEWKPSKLNYALYSIAIGKKSYFPVNITFSRKILFALQNGFLSVISKNKSVFSAASAAQYPQSRKATFSRKIVLYLRRFGLIM
jgi:SAM-dependent methyltransferase